MMVAFQHITFFSINCLVEPNNCVTHTHTHSSDRSHLIIYTRDARVIYKNISFKQRVYKKFFKNFLYTLFVWMPTRIKAGITNETNNKV